MLRYLIAALMLAVPAMAPAAEEVVLGMSKDKVAITTRFDGSEILIFGAVKRETAIPDDPLHVVITVAGPDQPVVVRRKSKWLGMIWVNRATVEVESAPSFYAVATSGPMSEVLSESADKSEKISVRNAIHSAAETAEVPDAASFTDAVIRIREDSGLYQMLEGQVALDQQTLFRTSIAMPANLTEGDYITRIFLTRGGEIISRYETTIDVRKVGLERWLYTLSRQQPALYGLMSLAIAIIAGWGASAAFQLARNR